MGAAVALALGLTLAGPAGAGVGELRVEIYEPAQDRVLESTQTMLEVEGGASIFGGVRHLDLFFVLDGSKSLRRTDPEDYRAGGAIGLVDHLSPTSDIRIGVVGFDWNAELLMPLTPDRRPVVDALEGLERRGGTDLAAGIRTALEGLEVGARPDSTRAILLFTDGKSDADEAMEAADEALRRGVVVHTLLLGSDRQGKGLLEEIANRTGGSSVHVDDPAKLPEAFLDLRTTGVDRVTVQVNDAEPIDTRLLGGRFRVRVPLEEGRNEITARAVSLDGRTREDRVRVMVRAPGCSELQVNAVRDGAPALSLSERAVEIVFDASNSMWGRMEGRPKMTVAQDALEQALTELPGNLRLGLRAYGHRRAHDQRDCRDSELLTAHGPDNHADIRQAIRALQPRGQTPLAYSLAQLSADFGGFRGERAVVLVTDGIESCGGDPVEAARALQQGGSLPIHVIGFGLGRQADEDEAQLRGIAEASGGRFLLAHNAEELRAALATTVGTPFRVFRGEDWVASGTLGTDEGIRLGAGQYTVRLEASPPVEAGVTLRPEEGRTLTLVKEGEQISTVQVKRGIPYLVCSETGSAVEEPVAWRAPATPTGVTPPSEEPVPASLADEPAWLEPALAAAPTGRAAPGVPLEASPPLLAEPKTDEGFDGVDAHMASAALVELREAPLAPPETSLGDDASRPQLALVAGEGTVEVFEDQRRAEPFSVVVSHPHMRTGVATVWSGIDPDVARQVAQGIRDTLRGLSLQRSP